MESVDSPQSVISPPVVQFAGICLRLINSLAVEVRSSLYLSFRHLYYAVSCKTVESIGFYSLLSPDPTLDFSLSLPTIFDIRTSSAF